MLALAGGYYAGHFVRGVYLTRAAGSNSSAVEEDAPVAGDSAPVPPLLTLDPDAPLPTTVEALYAGDAPRDRGAGPTFPGQSRRAGNESARPSSGSAIRRRRKRLGSNA